MPRLLEITKAYRNLIKDLLDELEKNYSIVKNSSQLIMCIPIREWEKLKEIMDEDS